MNWIPSVLLLALFLLFLAANISGILNRHSLVPFLGAICGVLALSLMPIEGARKFIWVPIILDPGTPMIIIELYSALKGDRDKQKDD